MLTAISPVDGRYASKTKDFAQYFSEYGLIRYRVFVEIQYFLALLPHQLKPLTHFPEEKIEEIEKIIKSFNEEDAAAIKRIERENN